MPKNLFDLMYNSGLVHLLSQLTNQLTIYLSSNLLKTKFFLRKEQNFPQMRICCLYFSFRNFPLRNFLIPSHFFCFTVGDRIHCPLPVRLTTCDDIFKKTCKKLGYLICNVTKAPFVAFIKMKKPWASCGCFDSPSFFRCFVFFGFLAPK